MLLRWCSGAVRVCRACIAHVSRLYRAYTALAPHATTRSRDCAREERTCLCARKYIPRMRRGCTRQVHAAGTRGRYTRQCSAMLHTAAAQRLCWARTGYHCNAGSRNKKESGAPRSRPKGCRLSRLAHFHSQSVNSHAIAQRGLLLVLRRLVFLRVEIPALDRVMHGRG